MYNRKGLRGYLGFLCQIKDRCGLVKDLRVITGGKVLSYLHAMELILGLNWWLFGFCLHCVHGWCWVFGA